MARIALVRRPTDDLADGIVTHLERTLVDISEFEKLEGCVTCLSVLVR